MVFEPAPAPEPLDIARWLGRIYPGWSEALPRAGIVFFRRVDHWHLVSVGLAGRKRPFELTFRVGPSGTAHEPPGWAVNVLRNIAQHLATTGDSFDVGHQLDAVGTGIKCMRSRRWR
jgi:hypothetical protein